MQSSFERNELKIISMGCCFSPNFANPGTLESGLSEFRPWAVQGWAIYARLFEIVLSQSSSSSPNMASYWLLMGQVVGLMSPHFKMTELPSYGKLQRYLDELR